MATTIKLKNSVTTTNAPSSLAQGEVAINVTDKKVWVGNAATTPVQLLGDGSDSSFTNISVSGVASFADGTASLPSITNIGDTNTGIYFPAADTIAFTEGGVESMRINSSGNVGIGRAPSYQLDVYRTGTTNTTLAAANDNIVNILQVSGNTAGVVGTITSHPLVITAANTERMRIDTLGNVGIGISSPISKLDVAGSNSRVRWDLTNSYTYQGSTNVAGNAFANAFYDALSHQFGTSSVERMRIDSSGNVGIGTSSPGTKLDTVGTYRLQLRTDDAVPELRALTANGAAFKELGLNGLDLRFITSNTERMRLDSSGNLGLGVTPSAWYSTGYSALQVKGSSLYSTSGNDTNLISNAYLSTAPAWTYISTAAASRYEQVSGQHRWHTAPSGTAGNAITFTQAMTLDASGNLGIGTSSPSSKLHVAGGSGSTIRNVASAGSSWFVGSNVDSYILHNESNTPMLFTTNGTERMRIDSSGTLLVGTTSNLGIGERLSIKSSSNTTWAQVTQVANTGNGSLYTNISGTDQYIAVSFRNNGTTFSERGNITVSSTTTTYNTSSDYRLKENIAPMTGALAKNALLKPVTYTWKADGSAGEGFIAHELAEVMPDAVTGEKDAVNEDGTIKPQGIDTSFLVGHLVACIQELKAEVDSLKAQLNK